MIIAISGKKQSGKNLIADMIHYYYDRKKGFINYPMSKYIELNQPNTSSTFKNKAFADKVKDIVCLLTRCTREQLEDEEFKNKKLDPEWTSYLVSWIDSMGIDYNLLFNDYNKAENKVDNLYLDGDSTIFAIEKNQYTYRNILQIIGTDLFRNQFHPDTWVNALFADYNNNNWIITDVRFSNELERIKEYKGIIIRVERPLYLRFPKLYDEFKNSISRVPSKEVKSNNLSDYAFMEWIKGNKPKVYKSLIHESETSLDNYSNFDYTIINNNSSYENLYVQVREILDNINKK